MTKAIIYILSFILLCDSCIAQNQRAIDSIQRRRYFDSVNKLSAEDHSEMMHQLNISSLRPGPSGNPNAPNAANIDEAKASPYISLPDPLLLNNGEKVKQQRGSEESSEVLAKVL